jgi:hypothetical protein
MRLSIYFNCGYHYIRLVGYFNVTYLNTNSQTEIGIAASIGGKRNDYLLQHKKKGAPEEAPS